MSAPGPDRPPSMIDLLEDLEELRDTVDDPTERRKVRETMEAARNVEQPGVFGRVIAGFGRADLAEALVGSVLFAIPMAVEDGTLAAGRFVARSPLFVAGTVLATLGLVVGILYVADFQDVRITHRILGVVPRRFVGVVGIAYLTAAVLLTGWGRVDWATPWLAFAQVAVATVPTAVGAALGDILPGS